MRYTKQFLRCSGNISVASASSIDLNSIIEMLGFVNADDSPS